MISKLSNNDKEALKQALAKQIENIMEGINSKSGYQASIEHINEKLAYEYLVRLVNRL